MDETLILVVDDDRRTLRLIELALSRAGFGVALADSWVDANAVLGRSRPRVAVVDVHMAALRGDELAAIVKRSRPEIKVVLYSSEDQDTLQRLAADAGADGAVSKCAGLEELLRAVTGLVRAADAQP